MHHSPFGLLRLIAFIFCFSTSINTADATIYDIPPTNPLETYIKKKCKKGCVNTDLLQMAIHDVSQEYHIPPPLLLAIISVESNFKVKASNPKGGLSVGLMQIQPKWHRSKFRTSDYTNIFENIRVGAMVFKDCLTKHKNKIDKSLWCYNGHGKYGMSTYVPKVLSEYHVLKSYV